jgi:hypothetical protein
MIFTKSLLLGSAASVVAIAAAQSADLPTKKSAPAEYVKLCNVGGMAGFVLPGSGACLQIAGYSWAGFNFGNLNKSYGPTNTPVFTPAPGAAGPTLAAVNPRSQRPSIGYDARFDLSMDVRSNTEFGVLRGFANLQFDFGGGLNVIGGPPSGGYGYIDEAYVQWAGITAGRVNSFYSFFGGGEGWANIFGPSQNGSNEPVTFAYTATFGGGFSATIAMQDPLYSGTQDTNFAMAYKGTSYSNYSYNGLKAPDVVGVLRLDQSWGALQASGVAHNVSVTENADAVGLTHNGWGYGFDAGAKFNLPTLGAGDFVEGQFSYSKSAIWFSGLSEGEWGENGQVNGNGIAMPIGDTYFYRNAAGAATWATPTAWSVGAIFEHHFSPQFTIGPEVSYGQLHWSDGGAGGNIAANTESWIVGWASHYDPVPHLDFELELLYQDTHQSKPNNYSAAANGGVNFPSTSNGLEGRFQVTRDF